MAASQEHQRLTKVEPRTLSALLQRDAPMWTERPELVSGRSWRFPEARHHDVMWRFNASCKERYQRRCS